MNYQKYPGYQAFIKSLVTAVALMATLGAQAQGNSMNCGELKSHYGPFDYRTNRGETLDVVERHHFTPEVEALIRGKSTIHIGSDLSYTLGTFPNHHRALISMMRLGEKLKTPRPPHTAYSVECYFERALRFRPDDLVARMLYATFLHENNRKPEALRQLEQVEKAADATPLTHYNVGLIYFDMAEYEKALTQAHKARSLGLPRNDLREKLVQVGKWIEPASPAPSNLTPNQN